MVTKQSERGRGREEKEIVTERGKRAESRGRERMYDGDKKM